MICKDEDLLREELVDKARVLVNRKYGNDVCSVDFDWGDTGDDSIGIDAYVYFTKSEEGRVPDGKLTYEFIPDGGVDEEVVMDCCNIIGKVVDPEFDYSDWVRHDSLEFEYDREWIRVFIGLTVPNMTKEV